MNTTTNALSLTVSRFIKAPRERVFDAWTKPEQVMRWMGPGTCHLLAAKMDPRAGGEYHFTMKTENHASIVVHGIYREVTAPSRLVFTWAWMYPGEQEEETLVTVELEAVQGGTHVTLKHEGFTDEESRDNHTHGWTGTLDNLERSAQAAEECRTPGHFSWNELHAKNLDVATTFYTRLLGWEAVPMPGGAPYTLFKSGKTMAGGMMAAPCADSPSMWLAYITVANVDESAASAGKLGAKIIAPPKDIPDVGRIAVVQDPQGAVIGLFQPLG